MLKPLLSSLIAALSLFLFTIPAYAYVDLMDSAINNSIHSYINLAPAPEGSHQERLPDKTYLSFATPANPMGSAVYRVHGAQQATVGIYTQTGTFVTSLQGTSITYTLGYYGDSPEGIYSELNSPIAKYSPSFNAIYANIKGAPYSLFHHYIHEFVPCSEKPPQDLIGYGVNIYVSPDGTDYRLISITRQKINLVDIDFCYEEFSAAIPYDTQYIRVEINDVNHVPYKTHSGVMEKSPRFMTGLAMVSFQGANLVLGPPEPVGKPEDYESSPLSSDASSVSKSNKKPDSNLDQAFSTSNSVAASASSSNGRYVSSSTSSSKFQGVIVTSSTAGTSKTVASSKTASSSASSQKISVSKENPTLELNTVSQHTTPVSYQVQQASTDISPGIIGYTIAVCAVIAFILLKPRNR